MSMKKRMKELNKAISNYDSDEDLDIEDRRAIRNAPSYKKDDIRKKAWEKKGMFKKLKRTLKDAWSGDIHKKDEEIRRNKK